MTAVRTLVWACGVGLCGLFLLVGVRSDKLPPDRAWVVYASAAVAITIGAVVWARRPDSRTGLLLTAIPIVSVLADLNNVFPESAPAVTVGFGSVLIPAALFTHLVLSYPSGRLETRSDRWFVVFLYGFSAAYGLVYVLFFDTRAPRDPEIWECATCALPLTHVAWYDISGVVRVLDRALVVLALLSIALAVRKLVRSSVLGRSVVLPLVAAAVLVAVQFAAQILVLGGPVNSWTSTGGWFWVVTAAGLLVPFALAAGLLWGRGARAAVADLVVGLERPQPGSLRDLLARTLGDPSLELALWLPERGAYVDVAGKPVELPPPGSSRAVTVLGRPEAPVAAIVHDPVLLERRALLDAAGAAARLALENERLQAALRAQLAELRASRSRIVHAADDERRRLERDLHDGAQQRLISVGLALQLAQAALGPSANGATELLRDADTELREALEELRELARGIHPAVLTEQGLPAALATLAERASVPVTIVDVPAERLPAPIEAAAYFLVSEALANTARYASASSVRVSVSKTNGRVVIDVDDDGVGGAVLGGGSGLRGLADRLRALDGELDVESQPGRGTHLHAVVPCA
jgi:signal transduction histidine kinase